MKHDLRNERLLLCEPVQFESACKRLDDAPGIREMKAHLGDDDEDEDCDAWGDPMPKAETVNGVSVIPLRGVIVQGMPSIYTRFGFCDLAQVRSDLLAAVNDPGVRAILVDANTPGGMVTGTPETAAILAAVNRIKPVSVFASGQLASAGYYVCAGASAILAQPSAMIGSVGIFSNIPQDRGFWEKMGVSWQMFKSGEYKGAGSAGQDLSEKQKAEIQNRVDALGADFRAHVSKYRPAIDPDEMQGQQFFGTGAINAGYCDDLVDDRASLIAGLARLTI